MSEHPLQVNLRHLEKRTLHLDGEVSAEALGLESRDPQIHLNHPLRFNLEVEQVGAGLLVRGSLAMDLDCECVRCLAPFRFPLRVEEWTCHVPLEGDDSAPAEGDLVDLTPYVREDTVLAFPQHPLCGSKCNGLPGVMKKGEGMQSPDPGAGPKSGSDAGSVWDQLDKLKLR